MADIILRIGIVIFFILFVQLLFIFILLIISTIKQTFFASKSANAFSPPFTVLIPAYNESKVIEKCLTSVINSISSYPNKKQSQIIVIDDGSTDDTCNIVLSYTKKHKKITQIILLKQAHKGKVEALNLGAKHSSHEFIVSIDADTNVEKHFFTKFIQPFADKTVGAVSSAVLVENKQGLLGRFQLLEYAYNNLIRASFSSTLSSGIWFFGCLGGYRKSVLKKIGGFKSDTLTEDMDISVEVFKAGFKAINVPNAVGYTLVPTTFNGLLKQRARWWAGGLQTVQKHKSMLTKKSSFAIKYLFYNHLWWACYAWFALPLFVYQINYWWPTHALNATTLTITSQIGAYLFRWFSFAGPVYTLYMNIIGQWAWSYYNIFGLLSGVISAILLIVGVIRANENEWLKNSICIFFYFPYTIILNIIMIGSVIRFFSIKNRYFIK